jgi:hypothetical protein
MNSDFIASLIAACITFILVLAGAFLTGFVVMVLWNWLMPVIFGLPEITYWQAYGLIVLAQLIFPKGSSSSSK